MSCLRCRRNRPRWRPSRPDLKGRDRDRRRRLPCGSCSPSLATRSRNPAGICRPRPHAADRDARTARPCRRRQRQRHCWPFVVSQGRVGVNGHSVRIGEIPLPQSWPSHRSQRIVDVACAYIRRSTTAHSTSLSARRCASVSSTVSLFVSGERCITCMLPPSARDAFTVIRVRLASELTESHPPRRRPRTPGWSLPASTARDTSRNLTITPLRSDLLRCLRPRTHGVVFSSRNNRDEHDCSKEAGNEPARQRMPVQRDSSRAHDRIPPEKSTIGRACLLRARPATGFIG